MSATLQGLGYAARLGPAIPHAFGALYLLQVV